MAVDEERLEAATRNSAGGKREQKDETPKGTWLGGAQRGGLWLRNGKVGSQVTDKARREVEM